jgi:Protein of unknown function (DUF3768)
MQAKELTKADKIRTLNDHLRTTFTGGRVMLTAAVNELDPLKKRCLLQAVRDFKDFNEDNDPHNEHDLGGIDLDGEKFLWKIDYYDKALEYGSDDPSDPEKTCRVLTIMHASDY